MKQSLQQSEYAIFSLEVDKTETRCHSVDEIIEYLKTCIDEHSTARFIALYDHYAHTIALPEGQVSDEIRGAKHIIFCFGITLPDPLMMAVRPRSIGVVELADRFSITFLEAPMPVANVAMEKWAQGICNR
ncbi:DUF6858 family protein [Solemya velesiana gill symbiont]|uniref:Uncharacterized protein n=1 Tax=Solemya velesiana gill symbiont TaxID=1918948 RepID=A0A1T2KUC1_9GAMM|nr:hypothetical protein [Solemya velesiana gill symbiont]OOZ36463.1 hypothetical protein BOW51_07040 [Solemya velesiana gill symbiont]